MFLVDFVSFFVSFGISPRADAQVVGRIVALRLEYLTARYGAAVGKEIALRREISGADLGRAYGRAKEVASARRAREAAARQFSAARRLARRYGFLEAA